MNRDKNILTQRPFLADFDFNRLKTPAYVIDLQALERNLKILDSVQQRCGAKILLALKGFATIATFPLLKKYLHGCCASSPYEARLAREDFGREVHSYAPAYSQDDIQAHLQYSDHILFNSLQQWQKYRQQINASPRDISIGLRVNPEHSETEIDLYNPCASGSRLGVLQADLVDADLTGIDGFHFHTLCQKGAAPLVRTIKAFEEGFGQHLEKLKWVNFGGGHHITQADYDVDLLCETISDFKRRYNVDVYLEPGEAIAINTGSLVATVLDVVSNDLEIAILNVSATCHMPDVLEMPYRPQIRGTAAAGVKPHTYRIAGISCLAGDVIGDYSFEHKLAPGDSVILDDMSHYTMVKSTFFNGIQHPTINLYDNSRDYLEAVRQFSYENYKSKL